MLSTFSGNVVIAKPIRAAAGLISMKYGVRKLG
jgi:hypothetical protein